MDNMLIGVITSTCSSYMPPEVRRGATSGLQRNQRIFCHCFDFFVFFFGFPRCNGAIYIVLVGHSMPQPWLQVIISHRFNEETDANEWLSSFDTLLPLLLLLFVFSYSRLRFIFHFFFRFLMISLASNMPRQKRKAQLTHLSILDCDWMHESRQCLSGEPLCAACAR